MKQLRARGVEVFLGNAAAPELIAAANISQAKLLFVAIPQSFEAGQIVEQARAANASLEIIARAHSDADVDYLNECGASFTIMGEREIAQGMVEHALRSKAAPGA